MKLSAISSSPIVYTIIQLVFGRCKKTMFDYLQKVVTLRPDQRLLDVGCGTGELGQLFSAHYVGIDLSESYLTYARRNVPRGTFEKMSADAITYPDASFDHVLCTRLLHHLSDAQVEATLEHMKRVVKPGGRVDVVDGIWPRRRNIIGTILFGLDLGKHQRSGKRLKEIMARNGFLFDTDSLPQSFPVRYIAFHFSKPSQS